MQRLDSALDVFIADDEADVDRRSAVRDHRYIHLLDTREYSRGHARGEFQVLANQTDQGLVALDHNLAELLEVGNDAIEMARIIERHGNADLGGRNHIDRSFMAIEDIEETGQKTVRHQHPVRGYV